MMVAQVTPATPQGVASGGEEGPGEGPKFFVNVEGTEHPWFRSTITTEEIAELGGWDPSLGVQEINRENEERTLAPGEEVELKPGHGFAKKHKFRRGLEETRTTEELNCLREAYPDVEFEADGRWFLVPKYRIATVGWSPPIVPIVLQLLATFPVIAPYGFYVPQGLRCRGAVPNNYKEPAPSEPPFEGNWGFFSWQADEATWKPAVTAAGGSNLVHCVRGLQARFEEGA